ncbi:hypothetical protein COU19_01310 [Candidatus Kaiserbacteria bacterium CG10_big_fil_rev_8_21_14_0_10_56_12]|uniref:Uncharacterized protein n=1 Tax=Candidatus Kaiserbacteria bacterium CG10_big_fil_rev_8_21_14_0_10_56_12 TaxID=1974611 RepID=A0A2H0UA36_9BACT|nr:MAG: hypothetical protein COU19_01310 [Candidatus Kaiserbacteria bacterium CG10_big_fil_rev_8_21_14_0_10_56_12]
MPKSPEGGGLNSPPQKTESDASAEWNRWKTVIREKPQDTPHALREGVRLGVPDSEIKRIAQEEFEKHLGSGWISLAYKILKEAGLGTPAERLTLGERVYQEHMDNANPMGAAGIARELWGEDSPQYVATQVAERRYEEAPEADQEITEPLMSLARDATFDDLFAAWHEMIAEEGQHIDIEEDMKDAFGAPLTAQVMSFLDGKDRSLGGRRVLDFFAEHGVDEDQLGAVVGIEFRKPKRARPRKKQG